MAGLVMVKFGLEELEVATLGVLALQVFLKVVG